MGCFPIDKVGCRELGIFTTVPHHLEVICQVGALKKIVKLPFKYWIKQISSYINS